MLKMTCNEILNLKINNVRFDSDLTIRGYLLLLLDKVWNEGECFNGKRPFGDSGWEYDLYKPLVLEKIITGTVDEDGDCFDIDRIYGHEIITDLIKAMQNA